MIPEGLLERDRLRELKGVGGLGILGSIHRQSGQMCTTIRAATRLAENQEASRLHAFCISSGRLADRIDWCLLRGRKYMNVCGGDRCMFNNRRLSCVHFFLQFHCEGKNRLSPMYRFYTHTAHTHADTHFFTQLWLAYLP